jgi:hypothetical protein
MKLCPNRHWSTTKADGIWEKSYQDLLELYTYIVELDKKISSLIERDGPKSKWENEASKLNTLTYVDVTKKIDEIVNSLATELHLKKVE